ncbi:MAG: hypothetical protein WKF68_13735 [Daejeonella sp.]
MIYQLHIRHYRSSNNDGSLWLYSVIFLSLLFMSTVGAAFYYFSDLLILLNVLLSSVFLGLTIAHFIKRNRLPFIEISEGSLNYWDPAKEEIVSVSAKDITQISTKLCQLKLHTPDQIHVVNLNLIKKEQTRWEIKENVRKMIAC